MSQDISENEAGRLIENRTQFKLYAAEQHLKNLENLEQDGSSTMHFFKGRVEWEMVIESFLFYILGVWDSLLAKINDNWELRLKGMDININNIKEWRNQVTHISLLPVLFSVEIPENGKPKVYFPDDQDKKLEVIPFLEDSHRSVKALLQQIIRNEPRLR
jgi:hypothetical protein